MGNFKQWAVQAHRDTLHFYDVYLPYELHLAMTNVVGEEFRDCCTLPWRVIEPALWGHDLMENARKSYNEIHSQLLLELPPVEAKQAVEIMFVLTDLRGRNRAERHGPEYWRGIRGTEGAKFGKCCDRLANARFATMMKSGKVEMHRKELDEFIKQLMPTSIEQKEEWDRIEPMLVNLKTLLT